MSKTLQPTPVTGEKKKIKWRKRESEKYTWPQTNDKEFSKRMFICFMWAFFLHIACTLIAEVFFKSNGAATAIYEISIPVYTTIFAAVIVKGGVENVFKGKEVSASSGSKNDNG